jgi:uncharacterized membrane protein YfcA
MNNLHLALFFVLGIFGIGFTLVWVKERSKMRLPTLLELTIGFVTDFFDTLGIGSFAVTTALFKITRVVPDEDIPGTLNIGHTIPTLIEAFIFIAIVSVGIKTLTLMIFASVLGSWLGAGLVSSLPRRKIQIGMGIALLIAASLFLMSNWGLLPAGGVAQRLTGTRLILGLIGNFLLGALMTLGIGLYAPCMILISLLGMNPTAAFPIMMGSCAFLMPVAGARFIKKARYSPGPALGLTLGGIPAVLVAAYLVKSLPLTMARWLVILVVVYTATAMLRSAVADKT